MTETKRLVEHFFRHEYANLVSSLTRVFGFSRIDLVEDMVGSAMLQAMNSWRQNGIPDKPVAWMHRVARNKVLDVIRREKNQKKAIGFAGLARSENAEAFPILPDDPDEINDGLLRMMFACCHPTLERTSQIAITLKILCGFSVGEVARGLLISKEAAKKRIHRAKAKLAELDILDELPSTDELPTRLASVHEVLYLLFNEGYSTSHGIVPIRDDIREDAARLCLMLCEHSRLNTPETCALFSLMLFHAARMDARTDALGNSVLLKDQDRKKWDRNLMKVAHQWLVKSKHDEPSRYHFEAAIAQFHCSAISLEATDWPSIIRCYDRLIALFPSPVYELNRAIAIGQNGAPAQSLLELQRIRNAKELKDYFLLDCAEAYAHELNGDFKSAIDCYLAALTFNLADHQKHQIELCLQRLALA